MKIWDVTGKPAIDREISASKGLDSGSAVEFQALLNEEIQETTISEDAAGIVQGSRGLVGELEPVALDNDISTIGKEDMSRISDAVGGALGRIADAVKDQSQDMKKLGGVIDSLSKEADELKQTVSVLPKSHGLRQIADELGVLAFVESIKWKRGDYL